MGTFQVDTVINAPVAAVWNRLAGDIGTIAEWNPGVKESYVLAGAESSGLGAQRYCGLGGNNFLKEDVVAFQEEQAITFRITETNMPFARADIRFTLSPVAESNTATKVTVSPDYKLKYGFVGELVDALMVKSTYRKGMAGLLAGLKEDVESKQ
jgi:ligand-binding SRPBCC domain-containing protein